MDDSLWLCCAMCTEGAQICGGFLWIRCSVDLSWPLVGGCACVEGIILVSWVPEWCEDLLCGCVFASIAFHVVRIVVVGWQFVYGVCCVCSGGAVCP